MTKNPFAPLKADEESSEKLLKTPVVTDRFDSDKATPAAQPYKRLKASYLIDCQVNTSIRNDS